MSYQRGRNDYDAIIREASDPATEPVEVSREEYWEMLECLPPIYARQGNYNDFLVMEAICDAPGGPVHAHFAQRGERFLARYSVLGRPETYIGRTA